MVQKSVFNAQAREHASKRIMIRNQPNIAYYDQSFNICSGPDPVNCGKFIFVQSALGIDVSRVPLVIGTDILNHDTKGIKLPRFDYDPNVKTNTRTG